MLRLKSTLDSGLSLPFSILGSLSAKTPFTLYSVPEDLCPVFVKHPGRHTNFHKHIPTHDLMQMQTTDETRIKEFPIFLEKTAGYNPHLGH